MLRRLIIFCFCLTLFTASAFAADKSSGDNAVTHSGGLTCFTVEPPPADPKAVVTCNQLCEARGAACTGVTSNLSPAQSCENEAGKYMDTCRCCAVTR